jgi:membrane-associated protease RseP (regulator of RpoE activity)
MRTLLSLTLAGLLAGPALASPPAAQPAPAARPAAAPRPALSPAEAAAARAEIDRLAARVRELAEQLGDEHVRVIRREIGPGDRDLERLRGDMAGLERKLRLEGLPGHGPKIGLGVVLAANPAAPGVRLAAVTPGGPAAKAGLRSGDVVLSIGGRKIDGSDEAAIKDASARLRGLKKGESVRLGYVRAGKGGEATVVAGDIGGAMMFSGKPGEDLVAVLGEAAGRMRVLAPEVEGELRRVLPMIRCKPGKEDCEMPALVEAFRWQGLNLSAIDADLGRYFGTQKGVLVLSGGAGLEGLRSGDVLQSIGGKPVETPREVMKALRAREVGTALPVVVLRDRKPIIVTITVPAAQALPFLPPVPPVPPTPPTPPTPPAHRPHALPPPPAAPPAPPPPPDAAVQVEAFTFVVA